MPYCQIVNGVCKYANSVVDGYVHCCNNPCGQVCTKEKKLSKSNPGITKIDQCPTDCLKKYINKNNLFTVETSNSETGPVTAGPFKVAYGSTLRLWSAGGLETTVTQGSALVQLEPNNILMTNGGPTGPPADPTRPVIYIDSTTNQLYVWNPNLSGSTGYNAPVSGTNSFDGISAVGRIYVSISSGSIINTTDILDPDDMEISFESPSGSLGLLQNNHLMTIPTTLNGISLIGKKVYVKVNLNLTLETIQDFNEFLTYYVVSFYKNDSEKVSTTNAASFLLGGSINDSLVNLRPINLIDILELNPGDTLDVMLEAHNNGTIKGVNTGSDYNYITFEILKIE